MKITYLTNANIDKEKWDRCIENAANGLIYAYSFYLDFMSENWDALVLNDYETVMPLTWKKKFGISYLNQPAFTQQLGIFGNCGIDDNLTQAFISKALRIFPFMEINLNHANEYKKAAKQKCNLVLSLNYSFDEIKKSFKSDLLKNITRAKKNNLVYEETNEIEKAISLYKKTYSKKFYAPKKSFDDFLKLCFILENKEQVLVRKVNSEDAKLLAIGLFLKDGKRIYKAMTTTLPEGRNSEANHLLLYELIKEFSSQNLLFDFCGSEIPSINFFLKKFGAVEQPYPFVKINNLSFFKKSFKNVYDNYKRRSSNSKVNKAI